MRRTRSRNLGHSRIHTSANRCSEDRARSQRHEKTAARMTALANIVMAALSEADAFTADNSAVFPEPSIRKQIVFIPAY